MQRLSARATWYVYEAAASFLGVLAFTVTAVYYVTEVGMSPLQLVLVGTFMEVSIFVFEVPTGVVADTYSRRLSIVIGTAVMGVAVILFGAFGDCRGRSSPPPRCGASATRSRAAPSTPGSPTRWGRSASPASTCAAPRSGASRRSPGSVRASVSRVIDLRLPIVVAGAGGIVLAAFFALTMPETTFAPLPREERGSFAQMRHTGAHGARLVRARPALLAILGIARVRRDVERGLRPPLAGALHPRRRAAVARRARSRRLVRRLRRGHDPALDRRRPPARQAPRALVAAAAGDDAVLARRVAARQRPRLRPRRVVLGRPRRLLRRRSRPQRGRRRSSRRG